MDFDNLPDSWELVELEKIFDIQGGGQPAKENFIYEPQPGYTRLLQIRDFGENEVPTYIPDNLVTKTCQKEDILIARYGASLGRIVTGMEGAYNVALAKVIFNKNLIFRGFVFYLLKTPFFQTPIHMTSRSAQNGFNKSEISSIIFPLPPLNEQKRIVAKIEQIQEKSQVVKNELEKIKVLLKKLRRSLLASAFRGDLTKDWRANHPDIEPAEVLLERIKQNSTQKKQKSDNRNLPDPFKILENWQWVTLFDICISITDGDHQAPPKTTEGIPFLVISNINKGSLDFSNTRYVPEDYYQKIQEHRKPQQGDIIYSVVGSYGIPVLIETDRKFCFQRHIALLKIHPLVNNRYLLYALKSDFVYNQVTDAATGTAQLTVSLTELRKIKIPLAPLEEQKEIVKKLEKMMKFADQVEDRVKEAEEKLNKFNQSVLAKAFRGELVPQDPNDETAAVLLGKIQQEKNQTTSKKTKK